MNSSPPEPPIPIDGEIKLTVYDVGKEYKLDPSKVQKMFIDVPGVIRVGHPASRSKRQYYTLRIPASVAKRVFEGMTVPENRKNTQGRN